MLLTHLCCPFGGNHSSPTPFSFGQLCFPSVNFVSLSQTSVSFQSTSFHSILFAPSLSFVPHSRSLSSLHSIPLNVSFGLPYPLNGTLTSTILWSTPHRNIRFAHSFACSGFIARSAVRIFTSPQHPCCYIHFKLNLVCRFRVLAPLGYLFLLWGAYATNTTLQKNQNTHKKFFVSFCRKSVKFYSFYHFPKNFTFFIFPQKIPANPVKSFKFFIFRYEFFSLFQTRNPLPLLRLSHFFQFLEEIFENFYFSQYSQGFARFYPSKNFSFFHFCSLFLCRMVSKFTLFCRNFTQNPSIFHSKIPKMTPDFPVNHAGLQKTGTLGSNIYYYIYTEQTLRYLFF